MPRRAGVGPHGRDDERFAAVDTWEMLLRQLLMIGGEGDELLGSASIDVLADACEELVRRLVGARGLNGATAEQRQAVDRESA